MRPTHGSDEHDNRHAHPRERSQEAITRPCSARRARERPGAARPRRRATRPCLRARAEVADAPAAAIVRVPGGDDVAGDGGRRGVVDLAPGVVGHQIGADADGLDDLARRRSEQGRRHAAGHDAAAREHAMASGARIREGAHAGGRIRVRADGRNRWAAERADVCGQRSDAGLAVGRWLAHRSVAGRSERHAAGREVEVRGLCSHAHQRGARAGDAVGIEAVTGRAAGDEELPSLADERVGGARRAGGDEAGEQAEGKREREGDQGPAQAHHRSASRRSKSSSRSS